MMLPLAGARGARYSAKFPSLLLLLLLPNACLGAAHAGRCEPPDALQWNYTTGGDVPSSPAVGADGTVYVGSNDDKLYALTAGGELKWNYTTGGDV
jgi:outer membrane protein assembly factor BamB